MFTISPIGSCRITTPLKSGKARHGFKLNMQRCYGYCHSPAEAVQLARFLRGEIDIPAEVWPLISRSFEYNKISCQTHELSDLYVVELSSAKELTLDGFSVQLNYLRLAFSEFFEDADRRQGFWETLSNNPDKTEGFLEREWSATEMQRQEAKLLGKLRLQFATSESLGASIEELCQLLPEVLFVSHVDAKKPDGHAIASRSNFIQMVESEITKRGLRFFNPTVLMQDYGQDQAIEDESSGLAHFTSRFCVGMMDAWAERFIAPLTDTKLIEDHFDVDKVLKPQIEAAVATGNLEQSRIRLEKLTPKKPVASGILVKLRNAQQKAQSDFQSVIGQTEQPIAFDDLSLLSAEAGRLGLYDLALDLMLQSEDGLQSFQSHHLLQLARSALASKNFSNAFEFAYAAFRKSPNSENAKGLMSEAASSGGLDILGELPREVWPVFLTGTSAQEKLRLVSQSNLKPQSIVDGDWAPADLVEYAETLATSGQSVSAVAAVGNWQSEQMSDRISDPAIHSLVDHWVASALSIENGIDRIHTIEALASVFPQHRSLRQARRDMRQDLVRRIRDVGKSGDFPSLKNLGDEVDALWCELPEYDLWIARLNFSEGNFHDVLNFMDIAQEHLSDRIGVWVLLMRAADRCGKSDIAMTCALQVTSLATEDDAKLRREAEDLISLDAVGT